MKDVERNLKTGKNIPNISYEVCVLKGKKNRKKEEKITKCEVVALFIIGILLRLVAGAIICISSLIWKAIVHEL